RARVQDRARPAARQLLHRHDGARQVHGVGHERAAGLEHEAPGEVLLAQGGGHRRGVGGDPGRRGQPAAEVHGADPELAGQAGEHPRGARVDLGRLGPAHADRLAERPAGRQRRGEVGGHEVDVEDLDLHAELPQPPRGGGELLRRQAEPARGPARPRQADAQPGAGDARQRDPVELARAVGDHERPVRRGAVEQRVRLVGPVDGDALARDPDDVPRERVLRRAHDLRARAVRGERAQDRGGAVRLV
ncbi:MAG: hypothetical protein AVDCRST_MAG13-2338, partial [uncultured Solirubrobacteraceae bacterium]